MGGLLNVGKAVAPKLAAGGLLGLGATASDDAEAGVSGIIRNIPDAIAAINKAVQGGAGQRNQIGVLEKIMHDKNFSNYDEMGEYAIKVDGDTAGDYWKGEVQSMADQIRKAGGLTDEADGHLQAWLDDHLGRELGWRAPRADPSKPVKRAPVKPAEPNNAFGGLKEMMAASAAAGAAGSTKAEEFPWEGPGVPSAYGPREEGSTPEQNGFTPLPDYDPTPVMWRNQDVMFGGPMGALGGGFSGGADEYGTVADAPMQAGQSLVRMIYEAMTGGGWDGAKDGAQQVTNQGVDATQQQLGDYVTDKTGDSTLGFYAKWLPYALSPL